MDIRLLRTSPFAISFLLVSHLICWRTCAATSKRKSWNGQGARRRAHSKWRWQLQNMTSFPHTDTHTHGFSMSFPSESWQMNLKLNCKYKAVDTLFTLLNLNIVCIFCLYDILDSYQVTISAFPLKLSLLYSLPRAQQMQWNFKWSRMGCKIGRGAPFGVVGLSTSFSAPCGKPPPHLTCKWKLPVAWWQSNCKIKTLLACSRKTQHNLKHTTKFKEQQQNGKWKLFPESTVLSLCRSVLSE